MTLIAFRVGTDHAEIMSDSLAYGVEQVHIGHTSKVAVLNHLDTAIVTAGPTDLARWWKGTAASTIGLAGDFDELREVAPDHLRQVWAAIPPMPGPGRRGTVFHIGWSPSQDRFAACAFRSDDDWQPHDLTDQQLVCEPPMDLAEAPPMTDEEWTALAVRVRQQWTLQPSSGQPHCAIGGHVVLTRLERGLSSQRRIHSFPTEGWEFRRTLIGSLHPLGQLGPCICGSGQPYAVCHLRWRDHEAPCVCGSEQPFAGCCRVDIFSPQARLYWLQHTQDFHRSQTDLAARWTTTDCVAEQAAAPGLPPPTVIPKPTGQPSDNNDDLLAQLLFFHEARELESILAKVEITPAEVLAHFALPTAAPAAAATEGTGQP